MVAGTTIACAGMWCRPSSTSTGKATAFDAKRGEVDTLEAHEVTHHVAPNAEHEPAMYYVGEQGPLRRPPVRHGRRSLVTVGISHVLAVLEQATKIPNPTTVLMPPTTRNATR